jgi:hypothetical protein
MMPAATIAAWSDPAPGTGHELDRSIGRPTLCSQCGIAHHAELPVFDLQTQRIVPVVTGHEISGYVPFDFPPLVRGKKGKLARAAQFVLFVLEVSA